MKKLLSILMLSAMIVPYAQAKENIHAIFRRIGGLNNRLSTIKRQEKEANNAIPAAKKELKKAKKELKKLEKDIPIRKSKLKKQAEIITLEINKLNAKILQRIREHKEEGRQHKPEHVRPPEHSHIIA